MRATVHRFLYLKGSAVQQKTFRVFMMALIIVSSVGLVLTSEPGLNRRFAGYFFVLEAVASALFLLEYILRIWSFPELRASSSTGNDRLRYILSIMGLADLASFLPFFLLLAGVQQTPVLLLLQLARLFKLTRYSPAFTLLADVLREEAESLLVAVMLMFVIFIFASVGIYSFEHLVQPDAFGSIPHAMWWAIVTLTTVGYGDVTPITVEGKIFATLITIVGVGLVSLPAGIIASGFTEQLRLRREQFQADVELRIDADGQFSATDMEALDLDRKELGLNRDNAEMIISRVQRREQGLRKKRSDGMI